MLAASQRPSGTRERRQVKPQRRPPISLPLVTGLEERPRAADGEEHKQGRFQPIERIEHQESRQCGHHRGV